MIYSLIDMDLIHKSNSSLKKILERVNQLKSPIVQYRNKNTSIKNKKKDILYIKKYFDGIVIVNDDIDLIKYCDGIHMGQDDILKFDKHISKAVNKIRTVVGNKKFIGISTHNLDEVIEANEFNIDYIGLGSYRETKTKDNVSILGDKAFDIAKKSKHPVALIGGVKVEDTFPSFIKYKVIGSDLFN